MRGGPPTESMRAALVKRATCAKALGQDKLGLTGKQRKAKEAAVQWVMGRGTRMRAEMGPGQACGAMDLFWKKTQKTEFIASAMRVIRFTLIFNCPPPTQTANDLSDESNGQGPGLPSWTISVISHLASCPPTHPGDCPHFTPGRQPLPAPLSSGHSLVVSWSPLLVLPHLPGS